MRRSQLTARLTLALVSLLATLVLVEFAGRALGLWRPSRAFRFNSTRGYELTPGIEDVNSFGLRGAEVRPAHRPGVRRIIVLGDSFTYGDGVTMTEALPAQLERFLNQNNSGPVEVLNLGVPGYNTAQEYAYFREAQVRFQPDLVIVAFTLSDADMGTLDTHSGGHTALIRFKEFVKAHVGLYDFARLQIRALQEWSFRNDPATAVWPEMYPLTLAARGQPSAGWDQCRQALQEFAADCRHSELPLLLVIWPALERLADYPYRAEHEFVRAQARALDITVLDLYPTFAGGDAKTWRVSESNPHPNGVAHQRAARAVAEFLQSNAELVGPLTH